VPQSTGDGSGDTDFNPILVRFKPVLNGWSGAESRKFQSYFSPIQTSDAHLRTSFGSKFQSYFSPIQTPEGGCKRPRPYTFQSYFSPIQTVFITSDMSYTSTFQSYFSPIQTVSRAEIFIIHIDFNPILVRFKRRTTQSFEFALNISILF